MSKVYLVNVGANTGHGGIARSPIFEDDTFYYVSFPHPGEAGTRSYPSKVLPFTRNVDPSHTHLDPDWENLTYGDYCHNARARALKGAAYGDVLLFWSLLWRTARESWEGFTGERAWYLIGALRIDEILEEGQSHKDARESNTKRAAKNAHFYRGKRGKLCAGHRVFVGCRRYSVLFPKAVDLEATRMTGLLFRTIRTADGSQLTRNGKRNWRSSTRACRVIWDLDDPEQLKRAKDARDAIRKKTKFDLLRGM